ncbi:MAG: glycoside hydrolase family 18 protein [Nostoc sp.]|uniref:glycoside hydrolase family 18 protein n=1 Tax=Nostoc sp. TaxID=1180 RepID=UPI002FFC223E
MANILDLVQPLRVANQLKVLISLGHGSEFNDIPLIEDNLATFAPSVKEFITENNLDGFDIDYEFPYFRDNHNFKEVAKKIRAELGNNYLFTITPNNTESLDGITLNTYFDYVNVQCYEYEKDRKCPISNFTQMEGLSKSKILAGEDIENKEDINNAVNKYKDHGLGAGLFHSKYRHNMV